LRLRQGLPYRPSMDRRRFLLTSLAGALAGPLAADAQPAGKVPRIGVVAPAGLHDPDVEGFRQGLRELGYVEGQNLLVEYRAAEGKPERFPDLFGEILRLKVDVIVTGTVSAAVAVKKATSATPVVLAASGDPVGAGVVASLAHPGANITGLSLAPVDTFAEKWVELLKEVVPRITHVALMFNPQTASYAEYYLQPLQSIAELRLLSVRGDLAPMAVVARPTHPSQRAHPCDRQRALRGRHRVDEREDALPPRPPLGGGGALTCRKAALKKSSSTACWPTLRSSSASRDSRTCSLTSP